MPLALERIEQDGRAFAVFIGERRCCIQHRGLGAEPAERLRQFEALRAGADDDEVTGTLAHLGQRFGGEVRRIEEAGNRRQHRRGAGGDDKAARRDGHIVHGNSACIGEARRAFEDAHASPTKRSRVAFGARAAMTSRIFAVTVGKSTLVRPDFTPKRAPLRTACARSRRRHQGTHRRPVRKF